MYNAEIKQKYIDQLKHQSHIQFAKNAFNASEMFEIALDRDLMTFDEEERLDLYKTMQIKEYKQLYDIHSEINRYSRWCFDEKIINENNYIKISYIILEKCLVVKEEVISYEELQSYENLLLNDCDKFLLEALYHGIKGREFCELENIRLPDIKRTAISKFHVQLCTGRTIDVTKRFWLLATEAANEFNYYLLDGKSQKLSTEPYPDTVFKRNAQSDPYSGNKMSNVISSRLGRFRKMDGFHPKLGTNLLYDSGFVNTCKAKMQEVGATDFEKFMKTPDGIAIFEQYGIKKTTQWNKIQKYKGYFESEND